MPALELDAIEARLLGVLIEKERTTPEQYPLSLNALVSGANQKSNRAPVMELSDSDVSAGIERLRRKSLVGAAHSSGARVERYRHAAAAVWELDPAELAVMAELMLRGAQMPGELRSRAERMSPIPDLGMLGNLLENLRQKGFVRRLEPLPGARAPQWEQIVAAPGAPETTTHASAAPARTPLAEGAMPVARAEPHPRAEPAAARPLPASGLEGRVAALEAEVARLARLYEDLARR
jgi:uncharacterized protein YceH (UPF0502 family)